MTRDFVAFFNEQRRSRQILGCILLGGALTLSACTESAVVGSQSEDALTIKGLWLGMARAQAEEVLLANGFELGSPIDLGPHLNAGDAVYRGHNCEAEVCRLVGTLRFNGQRLESYQLFVQAFGVEPVETSVFVDRFVRAYGIEVNGTRDGQNALGSCTAYFGTGSGNALVTISDCTTGQPIVSVRSSDLSFN